ncbi:unnamed protein product [Aspergillus oryzae]|uniref:Unnamed protein product n=2 Tax=Aspergillus oryzae TaxID=5062 RepID=A0AAN5BTW7_ASPOZ|nr:unnamed protein product [Aspergillus oryzae]GMF93635.1 unnamed protein product [Aspergillus oryzae]GMG08837.1 unnamed protein product [Aspergillus oryzae]GMG24721.1 unnamed protein product [Aspergillus oryzae]GMG50359.1 unnamed protein product [Aspergillus oryzae var. brunneus]
MVIKVAAMILIQAGRAVSNGPEDAQIVEVLTDDGHIVHLVHGTWKGADEAYYHSNDGENNSAGSVTGDGVE